MTTVAALIVGIDGWEEYTAPLVESLWRHEPSLAVVVIDNASRLPYPRNPQIHRTNRLCYSAAINTAHRIAGDADWCVVLSNDVICEGPFVHLLEWQGVGVTGPCLRQTAGYNYLEGWCVCVQRDVWQALGGWDEGYQVSSWEDVDFSASAMEAGFPVVHQPLLPLRHLDQRQRFTLIPNYWDSEAANIRYFQQKRARVTT
jgi:hypothetical protein